MKLTLSIASCPAGSNMEGQQYQFGPEGGTFGRSADNTWVLPDVSRYVSSLHARIGYENGHFFVTDQSTNGVFVNGAAQPLGANNSLVLNNGDQLSFGDYTIQVSMTKPLSATTSAAPEPEPGATQFTAPAAAPSTPSFDDLDKWLEPAAPASEPLPSHKVSYETPPIPRSESLGDIDLGLKQQETDPLAALGGANKPSASSASSAGALSDLVGGSGSLDQQMMKVPKIIPNDWDDLLGDGLNEKAAPAQPQVASDQAQVPPAQAQQPPAPAEPPASHPVEAEADADPGATLYNAVSETPDLSEILSTPAEKLQQVPTTPAAPTPTAPAENVSPAPSVPENPSIEPVAPATAQTATPGGAAETTEALARELGLEHLSAAQKAVLHSAVANTVKATVSGMMRTLRARSEIKSEFRMNMTTIQSAENNPLKFSVTPEDAIENMFAKQGKAYLPPVEAIQDGFADISDHQVALFDAMKAAYEHILGQFDPDFLAQKFERTSSKRFLGGKAKNWDAYQLLYSEFKEDKEQTFKRLFGEVFADAYERRMHSLKMSRDHTTKK